MLKLEEPGRQITDPQTLTTFRRKLTLTLTQFLPQIADHHILQGFPGSQPISFSASHLEALEESLVCEKSDGVRFLLYICALEKPMRGMITVPAFLIDRKYNFWQVNIYAPGKMLDRDNLFDGELVMDYETEMRFLLFDTLMCRGVCYMNNNYIDRLRAAYFNFIYPIRITRSKPQNCLEIYLKDFFKPSDIEFLFTSYIPKLPHKNDGLIFTAINQPYILGTNPHIVKWKPPELNTIDFVIKRDKASYVLYTLSNNRTLEKFGEIELDTEEERHIDSNAGSIAECCYDQRLKKWKVLKFRVDKEFANNTRVARNVWKSIEDNVTSEQMITAYCNTREEPAPIKRRKLDAE